MVLWWAGAVSRGMSRAGCGFRKSLGSLSADGWGCVPTQLAAWPEASQHWSLQAVGWSQVLVPKCQPLGEFTHMHALRYTCHQCLCPQGGPQPPPVSPGGPPKPAGRSGLGSYHSTAFALGPSAHENLCAPFKSEVSISPSPVELLQSSPGGLQSQMLWGLLFLVPDTWDGGGLTWGSELSLMWENLCSVIILQFVGHPPWGVWDLLMS